MKLEHIALTISGQGEINNFYQNILGFEQTKTFTLSKNLSGKIFDIFIDTPVFLMQKDKLVLEIFVYPDYVKQSLNHICLSVKDRETLVAKAKTQNYDCIRIKREVFDLILIKDRSGNIFEMKESNKNRR